MTERFDPRARPPHPAVIQRRRPPHAAATGTSGRALPPHAAVVVQPSTSFARPARPPHPATVRERAPATLQRADDSASSKKEVAPDVASVTGLGALSSLVAEFAAPTMPPVVEACYRKGLVRKDAAPGSLGNTNRAAFEANYRTELLDSGSVVSTSVIASSESTGKGDGVYQNNPTYSGVFIVENVHRSKEEGEQPARTLSLSEIVYFQMLRCTTTGWAWSRVLQISMITNPETKAVIGYIKTTLSAQAKVDMNLGRGIYFGPDDPEFCALLGTPLGSTAWGLLKDHGGDLGVSGIERVFCSFAGKLYFFFAA